MLAQSTKAYPGVGGGGAYIWRGDLTEGFLRYRFRGLVFGGVYTWRGLFSEFYGILVECLQAPIKGGNFGPKFTHLCDF